MKAEHGATCIQQKARNKKRSLALIGRPISIFNEFPNTIWWN